MPATFGQMLTAAREKRGLSIEDAAHETRIPAQRLRLLEADNIAGFGSMTYARSFVRAYSEFLELDPTSFLEELPGGVLGGERDYRYLTESHGAWLRERAPRTDRITAPASRRLQSIKSPLPAALTVFVLVLAGTAMWGMHVAEMQAKVEPSALKALPVDDDTPEVLGEPLPLSSPVKSRQVDFPVAPKGQRYD